MNMIEKKQWSRPQVVIEQFVPNEYIAACGDSGTTYNFICDAGGGADGDLFDSNGTNLTNNYSSKFSSYHACKATHEASTLGDFISGTFVKNNGNDKLSYWTIFGTKYYKTIPVVIWIDKYSNGDMRNIHATTKLNQNDWEVNAS